MVKSNAVPVEDDRELRKKICKPQIIRAYLLEKGDVFNFFARRYVVVRVTQTRIIFFNLYDDRSPRGNGYQSEQSMGTNSRQKIELLFSECEYYVTVNN